MIEVLVLPRDDVRRLIRIEQIIDAVQAAHVALAVGDAVQAIDRATPLPAGDGMMLPMAAMIHSPAVAGVKLLADVPSNRAGGLRSQHSAITLLDPATGQPLALLDRRCVGPRHPPARARGRSNARLHRGGRRRARTRPR